MIGAREAQRQRPDVDLFLVADRVPFEGATPIAADEGTEMLLEPLRARRPGTPAA